ncbi:MAG: response regulator transcription factor [Chloroflexi bacterium]|nr:response regulator transcription factor [Chloroflexota bacterium]
MKPTILLVDDEPTIVELAEMYLEREGYTIVTAKDGLAALTQIQATSPDLIVLDLMLPELDGWEVCRRVRSNYDIPIIMLTARTDDIDKIVGLELGADDYLTKPFNPRELVARVKAVLRRTTYTVPAETKSDDLLVIEDVSIDIPAREVYVQGQLVALRSKEFDLLLVLFRHPGIVLSRDQLLDQAWGYEYYGETRTVDVHVAHLRSKLGISQVAIETVWGIGYKLVF